MAATMTTMAVLNAKFLSINSPKATSKPTTTTTAKPLSLLPIQNLPKGLTISSKSAEPDLIPSNSSISLAGTTTTTAAIAGAIFSTLSSCDAALAAQQIAEIAEGDNRGLALLLPIVPAVAWVLFNILQPALNQFNRMKSTKGIIVGIGLSGLAASSLVQPPQASASASVSAEIAMIAEAAANDNRGQLLLFVITPAIAWVLYNILQPALNQLNKMRSE